MDLFVYISIEDLRVDVAVNPVIDSIVQIVHEDCRGSRGHSSARSISRCAIKASILAFSCIVGIGSTCPCIRCSRQIASWLIGPTRIILSLIGACWSSNAIPTCGVSGVGGTWWWFAKLCQLILDYLHFLIQQLSLDVHLIHLCAVAVATQCLQVVSQ